MGRKRRRGAGPASVERPSQSIESGTRAGPAMRARWRDASTVPSPAAAGGAPASASTAGGDSASAPGRAPASASTAGGDAPSAAGGAPASATTASGDSASPAAAGGAPASASTAGWDSASPAPAGGEEVLEPPFLPNSPLPRMPHLLEEDSDGELHEEQSMDLDPVVLEPYFQAERDYFDKLAEINKLATLDDDIVTSPSIIQESVADTILKASEFVLGLSSYKDGKLIRKCSGILMEWSKGSGTILTTAQLICSNSPSVDEWLGGDEYALNAEVRVQLLQKDDFGKGQLMYLDRQYGFALFSVLMDEPKSLACFTNERFAQDVFLLGRHESNLQIGNGKVLSKGTGQFQRHHYLYTDGLISQFGAGGAAINFEGGVIGMIATPAHFIPSSTIQKCLDIWRTYGYVPRIHLGMKLFGIKCLNLVSKEKISRKYNVDAGLIVKQVSAESNAEKLGVRRGDIVLSVNAEAIATAVELENKLLDISKAHLEKGIIPGSSGVDVMLELSVFNTTKCARGRISLSAKLSIDEEIIDEGKSIVIYRRPNGDAPAKLIFQS